MCFSHTHPTKGRDPLFFFSFFSLNFWPWFDFSFGFLMSPWCLKNFVQVSSAQVNLQKKLRMMLWRQMLKSLGSTPIPSNFVFEFLSTQEMGENSKYWAFSAYEIQFSTCLNRLKPKWLIVETLWNFLWGLPPCGCWGILHYFMVQTCLTFAFNFPSLIILLKFEVCFDSTFRTIIFPHAKIDKLEFF